MTLMLYPLSQVCNLLVKIGNDFNFIVNGTTYPCYYLLTNGVNPQWSSFVQTVHEPRDEKRQHFAKMQDDLKKDIIKCYNVLQARFAIIQNPCRLWQMDMIYEVMVVYVILHSMIIEDEKDNHLEPLFQ